MSERRGNLDTDRERLLLVCLEEYGQCEEVIMGCSTRWDCLTIKTAREWSLTMKGVEEKRNARDDGGRGRVAPRTGPGSVLRETRLGTGV